MRAETRTICQVYSCFSHTIIIDDKAVKSTDSLKFLGASIDRHLRFDEHISII